MRALSFRATLAALALAGVASAQTVQQAKIKLLGTIHYPTAAPAPSVPQDNHDLARMAPHPNLKAALQRLAGPSPSTGLANPDPASKFVVKAEAGFTGFAGLDHVDNRSASNGNQFSLEPPDQGLAVGNGLVFEAINDVLAVYDKNAVLQAFPVALNAFFGLPPEIIRGATPVFGPFLSDPRVYYDQQIQRWFLTVLELDVDSSTGNFTGSSHLLIAVSQSSNPVGSYFAYSIDTTDDGSNGITHPNCPCFGDQPLNGADANGFYVTTNEFSTLGSGFNGAQIYAVSKTGLASGSPSFIVLFSNIPLAEGIAYSVQPARSINFGTQNVEYFLSALDFNGTLDNRIAVWALVHTDALNGGSSSLALTVKVLTTETYGMPTVGAAQPPGPTPLGTALGESEETLNPNDDRMNQVVFENGNLWAGVNTVVGVKTSVRTGIAYFVIRPILLGSTLNGLILKQGYVAAPGQDSVLYPSIAVNQSGSAAMTFTLVGPTASLTGSPYFPSMGFTRINLFLGAGQIELGAAGALPEDGFSGYIAYGGNGVARWGDYSAAVADTDGSLWMAAEWIPNTARTSLANWGTFIGSLPK